MMESHAPVRRSHSLFFKLLIVILLTLLVVNLVVFAFWHHSRREDQGHGPEKYLRHYATLLLRELPLPLDTLKAKVMADSLGLEIRLRSHGQLWQTHGADAAWQKAQGGKSLRVNDSITLHWKRGQASILRQQGNDTLVLMASMRPFLPASGTLAALLGLLTLVLGGTAFGVRHLLKPMRRLQLGVDAISRGDFTFRLRTDGRDEVARLAEAFNSMAASVEQRIAARDQLLSDVSHELRSPLTRLRLAAEMLESGALRSDLLEDIRILEVMVQEILEGERLKSPAGGLKSQACDLGHLLQESVTAQSGRAPGIHLNLDGEAFLFQGDSERLKLAFRNLLDNALKYSPIEANPVSVILARKIEGGYRLLVRDQGPGIPEAERTRIFEPFYRVDKARTLGQGFGLGLALVKRICDAHGITLSVTNNTDRGACFQLDFPASG